MARQAYKFSKFDFFYIPLKSYLINIKHLKYESRDYFEHNIMSVKQGTSGRLEEGSKSPISDVGSLLWRPQSATLAAKELKAYYNLSVHWASNF